MGAGAAPPPTAPAGSGAERPHRNVNPHDHEHGAAVIRRSMHRSVHFCARALHTAAPLRL